MIEAGKRNDMAVEEPGTRVDGDEAPPMSVHQCMQEETLRASALASSAKPEERTGLARAFAHSVVSEYWWRLQQESARDWSLFELPIDIETPPISAEARLLAERLGLVAAQLGAAEASYVIGNLYTSMMPDGMRARHGAYYTPPALCEVLLDMAAEAGVEWRSARVLDPACGGGAFLAPVARRMASSLGDSTSPNRVLESIRNRLCGFELDPFAAWLSQVFLEVTLFDLCVEADVRLKPLVSVCDSLEQGPRGAGYDLVVGNPPYGRIKLSPELRTKFQRSLFGHANLYGLFTDLALRFARKGGVIAYVTPTSFLSGEYFKALRHILGQEAPPVSIDFVAQRKGVFADVLQETLLATYKRGTVSRTGKVHYISPASNGSVTRTVAGEFNLPAEPSRPWLIPRTDAQGSLVSLAEKMPDRLVDYGYTVSTGPLVWNRHKPGLRDRPGKGRYPLIWAESVRPDGEFSFRAAKRNHKPYFEPQDREKWVVTEAPCVLLQRTTAKEQCRRLIAAELPEKFILEHGAVVIENHLNMVKPLNGSPRVSPAALTVLLNSAVVDQIFRCINGSVAVSAYELQALPLPPPEDMAVIERLVGERATRTTLESAVSGLYGHEAP
ncbi:MAG: N-6 DNA methylase [Gammaproteobacteria bacterium]|nr:N-6 DNA methylase [Gammaproteobacteria bacterium]